MVYSLSSFIDNLFNIATFHFFTRGWTQPCARPARRHARARHRPPPGRRRDCALPNCCTTLAAKLPRRFLIKYSKRVSICYCTQRERHDDEENSFASCGAVGVQLMGRSPVEINWSRCGATRAVCTDNHHDAPLFERATREEAPRLDFVLLFLFWRPSPTDPLYMFFLFASRQS